MHLILCNGEIPAETNSVPILKQMASASTDRCHWTTSLNQYLRAHYPLGGNGSSPYEFLSRIRPFLPWIMSSLPWLIAISLAESIASPWLSKMPVKRELPAPLMPHWFPTGTTCWFFFMRIHLCWKYLLKNQWIRNSTLSGTKIVCGSLPKLFSVQFGHTTMYAGWNQKFAIHFGKFRILSGILR